MKSGVVQSATPELDETPNAYVGLACNVKQALHYPGDGGDVRHSLEHRWVDGDLSRYHVGPKPFQNDPAFRGR